MDVPVQQLSGDGRSKRAERPSKPSSLVRLLRKSVSLTCLAYIVDDWRRGRRLAAGDLRTRSGVLAEFDAPGTLAYGASVWKSFCDKAGVGCFSGRVVEVGPGDNDVVAWHLLANGAGEVHLVDRFAPNRDAAREKAIRRLAAQDPGLAAILPPQGGDPEGLFRHAGCGAAEFFNGASEKFDAILSCAVLQHVPDPIAALKAMAGALRPGGAMVHFINLRDHGMFEGQPPLTFLTVPDALWPSMTANSGRPNRIGFARYRDWLANSGLEGELTVSTLIGSDAQFEDARPQSAQDAALAEAARVRPRLARSLRKDSDADLAVGSFVLVARRPAE